jgi:hypothetical protein
VRRGIDRAAMRFLHASFVFSYLDPAANSPILRGVLQRNIEFR